MEEKKDFRDQMTKTLLRKALKLHQKSYEKLYGEEVEKRLHYRSEFLRRNDEFLKLKEKVEELVDDYLSGKKKRFREGQITLAQSALDFFLQDLKKAVNVPGIVLRYCRRKGLKSQELKKKIIDHITEYLVEQDQTAVEIVFNNGAVILKSLFLDYEEINIFDNAQKFDNKSLDDWKNERMSNHSNKPYPGKENSLTVDAVNKEDNTILLKIHLDRKKEDLSHNFDFLLDLIEYEAELLDINLASSKRPQWDIYDKYLKVYDLKKADQKMTWSRTAKIVFPNEVYAPTAHKRKPRQEKIAAASAINKVMRDNKEAKKMIKGGWRQI